MSVSNLIKSKRLVIRQMESKKEEIAEKVEEVIEEKKEDILEKLEDVKEDVEKKVEEVVAKVEEVLPVKVVEVVEASLTGKVFSFGCLGWKVSLEKVSK